MGKKITAVILMMGLIGGGIFWYFLQKKSAENKPPSQTEVKKVEGTKKIEGSQITENKPDLEKFYAPVLAYHHIALKRPQNSYFVSPEIFDEQCQWLKDNGYHVISLDKLYEAMANNGTLPEKPVVLTFDDGNPDNYSQAFPILKKYGFTATFFIKLNNISRYGRGMTWDKIKEMADAGMTIGSHTVNHNDLTKLNDAGLRYEVAESKKLLEKNLGIKIKYFCYPGGAYSDRVLKAIKDAGYFAATTTKHKVYQQIKNDDSLYTIPRVHIDDEMPTFIDWVQGINLY